MRAWRYPSPHRVGRPTMTHGPALGHSAGECIAMPDSDTHSRVDVAYEAPSVEHVWSCRAPRSNRHVTAHMIYTVTMDGLSTNSAAHVAPLRQPRANHLDDGDVHESTPPARTVGRADRPTVRGGARPTRTTIPPPPAGR